MHIVNSREELESRAARMAAVVYWTNLNSKQDLSAPSIPLWIKHLGVNKKPCQAAGYTGQPTGSAKCLINQIMLLQVH